LIRCHIIVKAAGEDDEWWDEHMRATSDGMNTVLKIEQAF
jgi:hypothetical protein